MDPKYGLHKFHPTIISCKICKHDITYQHGGCHSDIPYLFLWNLYDGSVYDHGKSEDASEVTYVPALAKARGAERKLVSFSFFPFDTDTGRSGFDFEILEAHPLCPLSSEQSRDRCPTRSTFTAAEKGF